MSQLQCLIKSRGSNEEFRKTAEVVGEGKDYLKSLSSGLSQIQQEANAFLTVLVEKEKAEKLGDVTASKVTTANSGDEDMEEDDEDGDSNNKEPVTKKPKT